MPDSTIKFSACCCAACSNSSRSDCHRNGMNTITNCGAGTGVGLGWAVIVIVGGNVTVAVGVMVGNGVSVGVGVGVLKTGKPLNAGKEPQRRKATIPNTVSASISKPLSHNQQTRFSPKGSCSNSPILVIPQILFSLFAPPGNSSEHDDQHDQPQDHATTDDVEIRFRR